MELSEKDKFDYLILNENLNKAIKETSDLIKNNYKQGELTNADRSN